MQNKNISLLKESEIGVIKSLIGNIPIVGGLLNESFFEIRGRIKQERINAFIQDLSNYMADQEAFIVNAEHLKSEDFSDLFENVLSKVAKSRSKVKSNLFKQILLQQIARAIAIDTAEIYLDIIDELNENQILILNGLDKAFGSKYNNLQFQILKLTKELYDLEREQNSRNIRFENFNNESFMASSEKSNLKKEIEKLKVIAKPLEQPYLAESYGLEGPGFFYLVQDLYSKGLVLDVGTKYGAEPFEIIEITQMGMDIITFLKK